MNTILLKCMDVESSGLTFIDVLDVVSKFAILLTLIGLLANMRQTRRLNFMACTAKYTKIQEIFLTNRNFGVLHLSIYGDKVSGVDTTLFEDKRNAVEKINDELALSAMLFQLMEDVWLVDLKRRNSWIISPKKRKEYDAAYRGWDNLFRDWMETPEIREKWPILKSHYNARFVKDTERQYRTD